MKLNKIIFLTTTSFIISYSQLSFCQEIQWENTIGGSNNDQLNSIFPTTDGGYICGGSSSSNISGDKTENSKGDSDYWILKLDSLGNIEWQKTIGGSGSDGLNSIQQTLDGGYICGGASSSNISGDKTENNIDTTLQTADIWIIKLDSAGNIQWQNSIGGSNADWLSSLSQTYDGGFVCGCNSQSNISGDKSENSIGNIDYWIIKLDVNGNIEWQNTIGGNNEDRLISVYQTSDLGYICGGRSSSDISGDKAEDNIGGGSAEDYWIVKLDSAGNIQWQNTIGGNSVDWLASIFQTSDGGYIVGGSSASNISADKAQNSLGYSDYWILKLDVNGNIIWQNIVGGSDYEEMRYISQLPNGGYICGGQSLSNVSGTKTENCMGDWDFWIATLDSSGQISKQNTIGGSSYDQLFCMAKVTEKTFIAGGRSASNASGDKTENCLGVVDYWIAKFTNEFNLINGKTYCDLNSNFALDVNEPFISNNKLTEANTSRFAFSQSYGNYNLSVLKSGNFSISPTPLNYYNVAPVNYPVTFSGINQIDSLNDFAFQPTGVFNDLCVTITPTGPFRSGFNASYVINYENVGTTNLSGNVIFFPWSNVTYIGANVTPTSISADSIVWNTGVLAPFQSGSITVTVAVNVGLPIGTLINSSVRIEPVAGDANPGCNYHSWEVYTIGSYDPNDILVSQDTILTTQLPSAPWLDYTIRFQNTGNDTAFTIKVLNPIDTNFLNLSTIEFVNSSHPVNLNYIPWERNMQFTFNNILLPDSNINEPLSHGFVHYRIKPKTTLQSGDSILNNAFIYFDFNVPVATNTVSTLITNPTSIFNIQHSTFNIKIVPNPSKEEITISGYHLNKGASAAVKIVDVMGKEVYNTSVTTLNIKLQTLNFSSGVYFVEVSSGNSISRARFVKQ